MAMKMPNDVVKCRLRLLGILWLARLSLVWLLAYPAYWSLAHSPVLHSAAQDLRLWNSGSELLLALLDAQRTSVKALLSAFGSAAATALVVSVALSTVAWRATAAGAAPFELRFCLAVVHRLPAFAMLTIFSVLLVVATGWIWLDLLGQIGATLLPWCGERTTDLLQLLVLALFLLLSSGILLTADVARGVLAQQRISLVNSLALALRLMRFNAIPIILHAALRLGLAALLHLTNCWLIAHGKWLASSSIHCIVALATTEIAALGAIWLRLDYMTWVVRLVRLKT